MIDSSDNTEKDRLYEQLVKTSNALAEHFESVQILVSYVDTQNNTVSMYAGSGNWHARQHMAQDFIQKSDARTKAHVQFDVHEERYGKD